MKLSAVLVLALVCGAALGSVEIATSETGSVLFRLTPATATGTSFTHFRVTTAPASGTLYLVDSATPNPFLCTGTAVTENTIYAAVTFSSKDFIHLCYELEGSPTETVRTVNFDLCTDGTCTTTPTAGSEDLVVYDTTACTTLSSNDGAVPPSPEVTIAFNTGTDSVDFTVRTPYLRDNTMINVDFYRFDPEGAAAATLSGNTCSNRVGGTCTDAECFESLPYAGYTGWTTKEPYNAAANDWSLSVVDCATVEWTVSKTLANLDTCDDGTTTSAWTTALHPSRLEGVLYVQYLRPVDPSSPTGSYYNMEFQYPFNLIMEEEITNIITSANRYNFDVDVSFVRAFAGTQFQMDLATSISRNGEDSPSLNTPTASATGRSNTQTITFAEVGSASCTGTAPCAQDWTLTVPNDASGVDQHSGTYTLEWIPSDDGTATIQAQIEVDVSIGAVDNNITIGGDYFTSSLLVLTDSTAAETAATSASASSFTSGDTIYVRHQLDVPAGDEALFTVTIEEFAVCFSDFPDFTPPSCFAAIPGIMPAANIFTQAELSAADYDTSGGDVASNVDVLSFSAGPLERNGDVQMFFHVRSSIAIGGFTREVRDEIMTPSGKVISRSAAPQDAETMTSLRFIGRDAAQSAAAAEQPAGNSATSFLVGMGAALAIVAAAAGVRRVARGGKVVYAAVATENQV